MAVYFIHIPDAELIKIGYSSDVPTRMRALATGSPYAPVLLGTISDGTPALERQLHRYFAAQRQHGEWFSESPTLLAIATGQQREIIEALVADQPSEADIAASDQVVASATDAIARAGGLVGIYDIARELGVSHQAVEKRIRAGRFPIEPVARVGRARLYLRAQLARLRD